MKQPEPTSSLPPSDRPAASAQRGRRRWPLRVGAALLGMVAVPVLLVQVALWQLDAAPIKRRVQEAARSQGFEIDYDLANASLFSGLVIAGLRVAPASADRALTPSILQVGEVRVGFSLLGLARMRLREVRISAVEISIACDEHGQTSLDRLLAARPPSTEAPPPPVPLSHLLASLLPARRMGIEALSVDGVGGTLIVTRQGAPVERLTVAPIPLAGRIDASPGGLRLDLDAGTPERPVELRLIRESVEGKGQPQRARRLATKVALAITSRPNEDLALRLDARLTDNDLVPVLPAGAHLVGLQATLRFLPAQERTEAKLVGLTLLDGAGEASAAVDLMDAPDGVGRVTLREARTRLDLDRLLPLAALLPSLGPLTVKGGALELEAKAVSVGGGAQAGGAQPAGMPLSVGTGGVLRVSTKVGHLSLGDPAKAIQASEVALIASAAEGPLRLRGRIGFVRLEAAGAATAVEGAAVDLTLAARSGGALSLAGTIPIEALSLRQGALDLTARQARLDVDLGGVPPRTLDGKVGLRLGTLDHRTRAGRTSLSGLALQLELAETDLHPEDPLASRLAVALRGALAEATVRRGALGVRARGIGLSLQTRFADRHVGRVRLALPLSRISATGARGQTLLAPTAGKVELGLESLVLDPQHPIRSRAKLAALIEAGPLRLSAKVDKAIDSARFDLNARADRLGPVATLLPSQVVAEYPVSWERVGVRLESHGSVGGFEGALFVDHGSHLELRQFALHRKDLDFDADRIDAQLTSRGTLRRHALDLRLQLDGARLGSLGGAGHQVLAVHGDWDFGRPRVDLHITGEGGVGPDGELAVKADWDPARKALVYALDGRLRRLGLVGVMLPRSLAANHSVQWGRLGIALKGSGRFDALVERWQPGMPPTPVIAHDPLVASRGTQAIELRLDDLVYRGADETEAAARSLLLRLDARADASQSHLKLAIDLPALRGKWGSRHLDIEAFHPEVAIDTEGDWSGGTASARLTLRAGSIKQDVVPEWPIGDLAVDVALRGDTRGGVRIERARVDNPAGGTHLELKGGLQLPAPGFRSGDHPTGKRLANAAADSSIPGRRNVQLEGKLVQHLDKLATDRSTLRAGGTLELPFAIESGDLSLLHASAAARFAGIDVELPASGLAVEGLNGMVPVVVDLAIEEEGGRIRIRLLSGATAGAYPRLRFVDHQPFMHGSSYLRARGLRVSVTDDRGQKRPLSFGPLAGNLRVDRNLIALDQLEMEIGEGRLSGQVLLDYNGPATELRFRGGLTGLRLDRGADERLDANAAVSLKPYRRTLEGRVELVRLGRRHLLRLLDLWDPYRADVNANRARTGLAVGFPKRVRLGFHQGFASLAIELGGTARLLRIDEIHGIPVGPLLERYLPRSVNEDSK